MLAIFSSHLQPFQYIAKYLWEPSAHSSAPRTGHSVIGHRQALFFFLPGFLLHWLKNPPI